MSPLAPLRVGSQKQQPTIVYVEANRFEATYNNHDDDKVDAGVADRIEEGGVVQLDSSVKVTRLKGPLLFPCSDGVKRMIMELAGLSDQPSAKQAKRGERASTSAPQPQMTVQVASACKKADTFAVVIECSAVSLSARLF